MKIDVELILAKCVCDTCSLCFFFFVCLKLSGLLVDTDNLFAAVCHTILSIFLLQYSCLDV